MAQFEICDYPTHNSKKHTDSDEERLMMFLRCFCNFYFCHTLVLYFFHYIKIMFEENNLVKKYAEEAYVDVNIPEDKPKQGHPEDCPGKVVKEFSDQDGGHLHCPVCGFWQHPKGEVS